MIFFKKIQWKNFLATGNSPIEIQLDNSKTTILLGPSGSGKSTLLDAVTFGLFGRPFRSIKKDQLVNSINGKNCVVEIEFVIGSKNYKVVRGIKPNIFEVYRNGRLIPQDASSYDYQSILEKQILKFNRKTFTQIVVLGASNFTPFMQLRPAERRIIIEELLDIEIFSLMNNLLREKLSALKLEIQDNENNIRLLEKEIELHEDYVKNLSKDKNSRIKENVNKILENRKQIEELQSEIDVAKEKISSLTQKILDEKKVKESSRKLLDLEEQIERNQKKTKKEIEFYHDHNNCPTCKQTIDEEFKTTEVVKKKGKLEEFDKGILQIEDNLTKLEKRRSEIEEIKVRILDNEREFAKNKNSVSAIETFIETIEKENKELKKPKVKISQEKENIKEMQEKKGAAFVNAQNHAECRALYETASYLLKDGGVKAKIIKQYLPLINKYVNKYLASMNFFVNFYIDEEFNESIRSRGRDVFSYENFSEGEKQRIDLALLFTWRAIARMKNSINTNLLIMDEVFDSYLDNAATENVIELLNSDLFSKTNIFVISHKETIGDKFHRILRFVKVKSFSRIE